jgi:type IV pilus assembly protein PilA
MCSSTTAVLNDGRDTGDAGFTLVELMVVLLILAILLAIAIPTFLGLTGSANDRAAQSNLNIALTNAKAEAVQNEQSYTGVSITGPDSLASKEPSIQWVAASGQGVSGPGPVSTYIDGFGAPGTGSGIVLASYSTSAGGTCWYAVDNFDIISDLPNGSYAVSTPYGTGNPPWTGKASVPNQVGTFYGVSPGGTTAANCDASTAPPAGTTWETGFPAAP